MKALRNNEAKTALRMINARREQISGIELELVEHHAAATLALDATAYDKLGHITQKAERCQRQIRHHWHHIELLRVTVDAGTTHMPEEGDFA